VIWQISDDIQRKGEEQKEELTQNLETPSADSWRRHAQQKVKEGHHAICNDDPMFEGYSQTSKIRL